MRLTSRTLAAALAAAALAAPAAAQATPLLIGTDGPGFDIMLRTPSGAPVKTLHAGTYRVLVHDRAHIHDFHLTGKGVDRATSVGGVATTTWTLHLTPGVYRYVCDPHAFAMHGSFRVIR